MRFIFRSKLFHTFSVAMSIMNQQAHKYIAYFSHYSSTSRSRPIYLFCLLFLSIVICSRLNQFKSYGISFQNLCTDRPISSDVHRSIRIRKNVVCLCSAGKWLFYARAPFKWGQHDIWSESSNITSAASVQNLREHSISK